MPHCCVTSWGAAIKVFNPDREDTAGRRKDSIQVQLHTQLGEPVGLLDQSSPDLQPISLLLLILSILKTTFPWGQNYEQLGEYVCSPG